MNENHKENFNNRRNNVSESLIWERIGDKMAKICCCRLFLEMLMSKLFHEPKALKNKLIILSANYECMYVCICIVYESTFTTLFRALKVKKKN